MSTHEETVAEIKKGVRGLPFVKKHVRAEDDLVVHPYTDAEGRMLYAVLRIGQGDSKQVRPCNRRPDGAWEMKRPHGLAGLLYRLPGIIGSSTDDIVWIVEGEKCADVLVSMGVIATTTGGSTSARGVDFSPLRGRRVRIWPDNDEPGFGYALTVVEELGRVGCDVDVVDVDQLGLQLKDDVADWVKGNGAADVVSLQQLPILSAEAAVERWGGVRSTSSPGDASPSDWPIQTHSGPSGAFESSGSGLWLAPAAAAGGPDESGPVWVCGPIRIVACFDQDGSRFGRLVAWRDRKARQQLAIVFDIDELEHNAGWYLRLVDRGLERSQAGATKKRIQEFVFGVQTGERAHITMRPGWYKGAYVFGDSVLAPVRARDGRSVVLAMQENARKWSQSGSLDDWRRDVAAVCAGHHMLVFAVCVAFSGPILEVAGGESTIFNLFAPSSRGKSTAIDVAASVWGDCKTDGIRRSWLATGNGIEGACTMANDAFLAFDELHMSDPMELSKVAYLVGNGQGKSRAAKTGLSLPVSTWRLNVLSNGEVSYVEHCKSVGVSVRDGQTNRFVDIDVGKLQFGVFDRVECTQQAKLISEQLQRVVSDAHGTAGRHFTEWLSVERRATGFDEDVVEAVQTQVDRWGAQELSGVEGRIARRFALVAVAGELATRAGTTGWAEGTAAAAVERVWRSVRSHRTTTRAAADALLTQRLTAFFDTAGGGTFVHIGSEAAPASPEPHVWWRDSRHGRELLVGREVLKHHVIGDMDFDRAVDLLVRAGVTNRETQVVRVGPKRAQCRLYALRRPP